MTTGQTGGRREKLRGVRKAIADHLTAAHREVPAVTFVEECDLTGLDLSLLVPLAVKALALTLPDYPELNARLEGQEIVYFDHCHIGVAMDTPDGLIVPVVGHCELKSVEEIAAEVRRLAEAARGRSLRPADVGGSTFTLTSAGREGGLFATPLVNYPEVGILGIHRVADRPQVRDNAIVIRAIANVSLSFDHRVVDGVRAGRFCLDVIRRLEAHASDSRPIGTRAGA